MDIAGNPRSDAERHAKTMWGMVFAGNPRAYRTFPAISRSAKATPAQPPEPITARSGSGLDRLEHPVRRAQHL